MKNVVNKFLQYTLINLEYDNVITDNKKIIFKIITITIIIINE